MSLYCHSVSLIVLTLKIKMYDAQPSHPTSPFRNRNISVIELDPLDKVKVTKCFGLSVCDGRHSLVDLMLKVPRQVTGRGSCIWVNSKVGVTSTSTGTDCTTSEE